MELYHSANATVTYFGRGFQEHGALLGEHRALLATHSAMADRHSALESLHSALEERHAALEVSAKWSIFGPHIGQFSDSIFCIARH